MLSSTKEQISKVQHAPPSSSHKKPWYVLAGIIIAWQTMAVLLVEGSLFVAGLGEEEIYKLDPELGFRHMCNKKVTWRSEGFATSYFDKEGLRDPGVTVEKPIGTYRVVLLGDSLTESLQVPVEQSFGYDIQNKLSKELSRPVQVINFGTSGYSTVQEYLQLKKQVLKFKPDLVLVCYNSRDCFENWSPPDEVLTNVRPAALHLPGQKLVIDSSPVTQWMRTPRAKFLKQVELLREQSRLWGLYSAAELDWSMHNETYKKLSLFLTRPGKAIRQTGAEISTWWKSLIATKDTRAAQAPPLQATNQIPSSTSAHPKPTSTDPKSTSTDPKSASADPKSASVDPNTTSADPKSTSTDPKLTLTDLRRGGTGAAQSADNAKTTTSNSKAETAKRNTDVKPSQPGRLNYQELIVRTLGSLIFEMKTSSEASGARFAVVALPVRSALSAKQGMLTAFNDFDYNDEIKMLQGICKEKSIPLINVHEKAKALSAEDRDYLFFLVHYTQKGHEFVAKTLAPVLKDYVSEVPKK